MRHWPLVLLLAILLLAALPGPSLASEGKLEARIEGKLPAGNYRAASVTTNDAVFIFGGRNETGLTTAVVRYDATSGEAETVGWMLPEPRMSACAVYDGLHAFVFGGANGGEELDTILSIDLTSGDIRTLDARLPSPRIGLSAIMYGGMAYMFGGHSNGTMIAGILRFDPSTEKLGIMGAALPAGLAGIGIAVDERGILLFGGNTGGGGSDRVMCYDPEKDVMTVLPERLPYPVFHAPAVSFKGKVLLIGGSGQLLGWEVSKATDSIIEFDPPTGNSRILAARLPSPRERTVAAAYGDRVLIFGGQQGVKALDEVVALSATGSGEFATPGQLSAAVLGTVMLAATVSVVMAVARRR